MARVAPINLAYNPRTLWFHPGDFEIKKGDRVVVETARGVEFGTAASDIIEVTQKEIKALKCPLKPVVRLATEEDVEHAAEMEQRSREALPAFKKLVAESGVDMHPVSVEFLLDGDKAVFYFEADERVDFRDLVRKLAAHFHVRIDMRQIGVRDEARIVGGLGHCGQELCCKRMGGDFNPVSIRMAKEQDLSLNPQKISGLCGRLMCCLRYEYDAYKDFKSRAPKANATVQTPAGPAKVVDLDVPREVVSLKVGDEKPVRVPLASFDAPAEGTRPTSVGADAWEEAYFEATNGGSSEPATFLTSQFTGSDKLAEAGAVRRTPGGKTRKGEASQGSSSKTRRARGKNRGSASKPAQDHAPASSEQRKPRRRRSTKIASGEAARVEDVSQGAQTGSAGAGGETKPRKSRNRSHSVEGARQSAGASSSRRNGADAGEAKKKAAGPAGSGSAKQGRGKSSGRPRQQGSENRETREGRGASDSAKSSRPRPGQKSSGLARPESAQARSGSSADSAQMSDRGAGSQDRSASTGPGGSGRRSRRRSHKPRSQEQGEKPQGGETR